MDKDEALKLALSALFSYEDDYVDDGTGGITSSFCYDKDAVNKAITAIKQVISVPVQQKPLFADIIAKHPGLAKELKEMDATPVQPVAVPSFIRQRLEREIEAAINPKGMSVHDGRTRALAVDIAYLLKVIDTTPPAQALPVREQTDWEAVAADQAMTIAMMKAESAYQRGYMDGMAKQRPWVGLTAQMLEEEMQRHCQDEAAYWLGGFRTGALWADAKLREKNA